MWDQHLSAQYRAIKPVMKRRKNGTDYWQIEGGEVQLAGLNAVAGRVPEEYGMEPGGLDQVRRGVWDIDARIGDMNANGIISSLNFPSLPGMDGAFFKELKNQTNALILLRAYNDWHIDEWCGKYPGRNIPLAMVPYWNMPAAVEEIRRVVAKGCHAITVSDCPTLKGCPSIHDPYWEPLWKACHENQVAINLHIGTGSTAPHASMQTPIDAWITTMPMAVDVSLADWLHLEALDRYPGLKLCFSEGGVGWIPYLLERAEFVFDHHHKWTHSSFGRHRRPTERFREHFIACFIEDKFGLKNYDAVGADNICYECDYPHSDCTFPKAPEFLYENVKNLPDAVIDKVCHENAFQTYSFDAFTLLGGRQNCTVGALRAKAKAEMMAPMAALFTWNVFAKSGIAGMIIP